MQTGVQHTRLFRDARRVVPSINEEIRVADPHQIAPTLQVLLALAPLDTNARVTAKIGYHFEVLECAACIECGGL